VDDLADACVFLMRQDDVPELASTSGGEATSRSAELAELVAGVVGYEGRLSWDSSRPDGTPRKLLDVSRMASLGWRAGIELREGVERTYGWFVGEG
jgi:GDP-L-fucose synthase